MPEPALSIHVTPGGEPLRSEVAMHFEPSTFVPSALLGKDFAKALSKVLGDGIVTSPEYDEAELAQLAARLRREGKSLTSKEISGLRPDGVCVDPAGQFDVAGTPVFVNNIRISEDMVKVNVTGTSEQCIQVIEKTVEVADSVTSKRGGWKAYEARRTRTRYGTAAVERLPVPLRGFLAPEIQQVFADFVEQELAQAMAPLRKGASKPDIAFCKVIVHGIQCQVVVVERDGTTNKCRLDFHHQSDEDLADHSCHIVSMLDYASHLKLTKALQEALETSPKKGA